MFTGIIETTGKLISLKKEKKLPAGQVANLIIGIESSIAKSLKIGQSVAHNGVCLTVEAVPSPSPLDRAGVRRGEVGCYYVTAVKETLIKTNLGSLKKGELVNLERSLKIGDRLDGHFVQGHVDTTAICKKIKKEKGSWIVKFQVKSQKSKVKNLVIDKGSICINGISLTVIEVKDAFFSVAIIPHTFSHTNFKSMKIGCEVNIEFDVLGKYIQKIISK